MKVLHAGIFDDHNLGGDIIFRKGLAANGCQVSRFAYVPGEVIDHESLIEQCRGQDLLFVGKGEGFSTDAFRRIRKHGTQIALWYGDIRARIEPWLRSLLSEIDFFFMSSGGAVLREYHSLGRPGISTFYVNPVDPDLVSCYAQALIPTEDVLFTATNYAFAGAERKAVSAYLRGRANTAVIGWSDPAPFRQRYFPSIFGSPKWAHWPRGEEYVGLIKGTKIGVGVSAYQDVPRYTSDRMQHYLTFGTFFLPWKFPQIELFFDYGQNLVWYEGIEDLEKKLTYYLNEPEERKAIASAGQDLFLQNYNTSNIVAMFLDIIRSGRSDRFLWTESYK